MQEKYLYLVAGALIGASSAYFITKKVVSDKYEDILQEEIDSVKQHYSGKVETNDVGVLVEQEHLEKHADVEYESKIVDLGYAKETMVKEDELEDSLLDLKDKLEGGPPPEEEIMEVNVRLESSPRNPDVPYVIKEVEFNEDQNDYEQITITYFENDDVLCDDREEVIPDPERVVGPEALLQFGKDSVYDDVVYVRNEKLRSDFEIVRDERSYAEVVLGLTDARPGVGKFREYDE